MSRLAPLLKGRRRPRANSRIGRRHSVGAVALRRLAPPAHVSSAAQVGRTLEQPGIPRPDPFDALAPVVWITWAILVVSLTAEVPAAFAWRRDRRLPLAGSFNRSLARS